MSNVDAPDLFALRAEIADLTARAADFAAALAPLIAGYRRVGDVVADLVDQETTRRDGIEGELRSYENWGELTGYGDLARILGAMADELNR